MRLRIEPARARDELPEFLRTSGCLALAVAADELETHMLNSVSDRHDRAKLACLVESWQAEHPKARVDVIAD